MQIMILYCSLPSLVIIHYTTLFRLFKAPILSPIPPSINNGRFLISFLSFFDYFLFYFSFLFLLFLLFAHFRLLYFKFFGFPVPSFLRSRNTRSSFKMEYVSSMFDDVRRMNKRQVF